MREEGKGKQRQTKEERHGDESPAASPALTAARPRAARTLREARSRAPPGRPASSRARSPPPGRGQRLTPLPANHPPGRRPTATRRSRPRPRSPPPLGSPHAPRPGPALTATGRIAASSAARRGAASPAARSRGGVRAANRRGAGSPERGQGDPGARPRLPPAGRSGSRPRSALRSPLPSRRRERKDTDPRAVRAGVPAPIAVRAAAGSCEREFRARPSAERRPLPHMRSRGASDRWVARRTKADGRGARLAAAAR